MKTKITISVMLGLLTLAFIYKGVITTFNANVIEKNAGSNKILKLTESDKQARKDYILSAKICKYECESSAGDFRIYETGKDIIDYGEFGSGQKVRYCKASEDKAGYIVRGLIHNTDQTTISSEKWLNGSEHNWIIRPLLRIDRDEINKQDYPIDMFKKVCRLEILNTKGETIKNVEMDLRYFMDKYPGDECRIYCNGSYRDKGPFLIPDSLIEESGNELNSGPNKKTKINMTDYRIYWYGECDLWLDNIVVENETADDLLKGKYNIWLKSMTDQPEITFWKIEPRKYDANNIPCIKYIQTKMKEYSNNRFAMIY